MQERTVGVDVQGYEYDYTLHAQASTRNSYCINGNTNGNTKYIGQDQLSFMMSILTQDHYFMMVQFINVKIIL